MTSGKGRYTFTDTPEKKALEKIIKASKKRGKETKEYTKAKRSEPKSVQMVQQPPKTTTPKPKPHDFDSHIEAYHATGNKDYLKAARQHAEMEYDREKKRIRNSGVTGAQHHVDTQWNVRTYKDRIETIERLSGIPKKSFLSKIKSLLREKNLKEQETHSAMEVMPRSYKTRYTGTPEQQHMYQVVRQRELRKQTAKDYKPSKLVPNIATEPAKPRG